MIDLTPIPVQDLPALTAAEVLEDRALMMLTQPDLVSHIKTYKMTLEEYKKLFDDVIEVDYESVSAVFATDPNQGNVTLGTFTDPNDGTKYITLNFDTTPINNAIINGDNNTLIAANNYTDEQIANIGPGVVDYDSVRPVFDEEHGNVTYGTFTDVEGTKHITITAPIGVPILPDLPTIELPLQTITNNSTGNGNSASFYQTGNYFKQLSPGNNYDITLAFNNTHNSVGQFQLPAGSGVGNENLVPNASVWSILDGKNKLICPIVFDNSLLTSEYVTVTIRVKITNFSQIVPNYHPPESYVNYKAYALYLNNAPLNIYHTSQTHVGASHIELSPAEIPRGESWDFVRTFAFNNTKAFFIVTDTFRSLRDVNVNGITNDQIVYFNAQSQEFQGKAVTDLIDITYNEASYLTEHPDFVPGVGPFLESFELDDFNYTVNLPWLYFNPGISSDFLLDLSNLDITSVFNLVIDNSQNPDQFKLDVSVKTIVTPTVNPPFGGETLERKKYQLIIDPYSIGGYTFSCSNENIALTGQNISNLNPVNKRSYVKRYVNDVSKQYANIGYYAAFIEMMFPRNAVISDNYQTYLFGQYFNRYNTSNYSLGGDPTVGFSFLPSTLNRYEFWKAKSYTISLDTDDNIETAIKTLINNPGNPKSVIYPRLARVRMQLPLDDGITSLLENTENSWEKEYGRMRKIFREDPTNILDNVESFEIFGWDGNGRNVYLAFYDDGTTIYLDDTVSAVAAMKNSFSFIQNIKGLIRDPSYIDPPLILIDSEARMPYYEIMPKDFPQQYWQTSNNPVTDITVYPNPYPADPEVRYDILNTTVNIDRPPVFFQGYFNLTFTGLDLTGMEFKSFIEENSQIQYPLNIFVSNYTNTYEIGLKNVLEILSKETYTPTDYIFPYQPTLSAFSGYEGWIFNNI